jgi:hypothetical protein
MDWYQAVLGLYRGICDKFESSLRKALVMHVAALQEYHNLVRDENVVLESERDGEFRGRLRDEVNRINERLARIHERIADLELA